MTSATEVKEKPASPAKTDPAFTKATNLRKIDTAIAAIGRSGTKLNNDIHATAMMILRHANEYGDCTRAAFLVDAMPKSHRRGLLINWFAASSPISIAKSAKSGLMKAHFRKPDNTHYNPFDIDKADATPFFAMPEAEREQLPMDYTTFHGKIVDFMKAMEKRADKIANDAQKAKAKAELAALEKVVGVK